MRGTEQDKKVYYEWYNFFKDCQTLADKMSNDRYVMTSVMGVRRGGIALAVRLADILGVPVTNMPTLHTLIVDDIVDSGVTRDKYGTFTFASLFVKPWANPKPNYYVRETTSWIIFPWEIDYE